MSRKSGSAARLCWRTCAFAALAAVWLSAGAAPLRAQLLRGSVTGSVADAQDAAAPGVDVTLTNNGTGVAQSAKTNDLGVYLLGAVEPGS